MNQLCVCIHLRVHSNYLCVYVITSYNIFTVKSFIKTAKGYACNDMYYIKTYTIHKTNMVISYLFKEHWHNVHVHVFLSCSVKHSVYHRKQIMPVCLQLQCTVGVCDCVLHSLFPV